MSVGSQAIRAGKAVVELFADDKKLVRGLKSAQRKLRAWGQSITAIGKAIFATFGVATAGMVGAAKDFGSMGDQIDKMSIRTGMSGRTSSAFCIRSRRRSGKKSMMAPSRASTADLPDVDMNPPVALRFARMSERLFW